MCRRVLFPTPDAPVMALLIATLFSFYTFGKSRGFNREMILKWTNECVAPTAIITLVVGAGGGFGRRPDPVKPASCPCKFDRQDSESCRNHHERRTGQNQHRDAHQQNTTPDNQHRQATGLPKGEIQTVTKETHRYAPGRESPPPEIIYGNMASLDQEITRRAAQLESKP